MTITLLYWTVDLRADEKLFIPTLDFTKPGIRRISGFFRKWMSQSGLTHYVMRWYEGNRNMCQRQAWIGTKCRYCEQHRKAKQIPVLYVDFINCQKNLTFGHFSHFDLRRWFCRLIFVEMSLYLLNADSKVIKESFGWPSVKRSSCCF